MNADAKGIDTQPALSRPESLLQTASGRLRAFAGSLRPLREALAIATDLGTPQVRKSASRLTRQLDLFEPSVTMIGQIKSGKTTLVNAMIGWTDLLPADVNPWTSVVTSVHLSPQPLTPSTSAKFRFFENGEWDRLVTGGGRIGELANRAGADDELNTIKRQIEMMREKTKARLGRKFEMLLGKEHSYGYFDRELVERYVCLGDDFDEDTPATTSQGRFADITKSADLSMQQRGLPVNLCIRDTPGVNDTFMIREQITIKSIRDSRICVVVLSAHQALSSTDLALIRLISNVKSREVIIFVNRIDELSDPATQVPQIAGSIRQTLEDHKGPTDAQVIFGSALWAQMAASGSIGALPKASQTALLNWAEAAQVPGLDGSDANALMWALSGLPSLYEAIGDRVVDGEGVELAQEVAVAARNLINGIRVSDNLDAKRGVGQARLSMPRAELLAALDAVRTHRLAALEAALAALSANFEERVDRAHASFLTRATEELAKHLEFYGEKSAWTYDPAGLRILLNSAYKIFGSKCQGAYAAAARDAVEDFRAIYKRALGLPADLYAPDFPPAPRVEPPVSLGQTIALDLRGSWWKGWWMRRRSYQAHAQSFYDLIKAETDTLIHDLTADQGAVVSRAMLDHLAAFLDAQAGNLSSIAQDSSQSGAKIDQLFGVRELEDREGRLSAALQHLERYGV